MSASGFHPTIELVAIIALSTDSFVGLDKLAHGFQSRFFLPLHAEVHTPRRDLSFRLILHWKGVPVARRERAMRYFQWGFHSMPGWRNWQTQRTQNPPTL